MAESTEVEGVSVLLIGSQIEQRKGVHNQQRECKAMR